MTPSPAGDREPAPLSVSQEALWYLSRLTPDLVSYNETVSICKTGSFQTEPFRRACQEVVRRHEAWRTTFDTVGGKPVQLIAPQLTLDLRMLDLSQLTAQEAERQAVRVVANLSRIPYDLRHGPLLRTRLIRFGQDHHRLYLGLHHIIFDGVSLYRVVLGELVALYDAFCAGQPSPLPEPPVRYVAYARWEQDWIEGPRAATRISYWRGRLAALPARHCDHDHPRPSTPRFRGGVIALSVPEESVAGLRALGQGVGATLFSVLATTWAVLLHRYFGQPDVVFATAADLRQRPEFESLVGYCLTPLVLRVDCGDDPTVEDLVLRLRNDLLDGLDHLVPFERVVRELGLTAPAGTNPVYETMIVLEPEAVVTSPEWSLHQIENEIGNAMGTSKLDLLLELDERPDGHIAGRLIYDRDLFEATTAARMAQHWLSLSEAIANGPTAPVSRLPMLTAAERRRQAVEWNATDTDLAATSVHALVTAQAGVNPGATAVSDGAETISYAELERQATRAAQLLRDAGVGAGSVVAVCATPSVALVVGTLAALRVGAAYAMLDPLLSAEHLARAAGAGDAAVVLTLPELAPLFSASGAEVVVLDRDHQTAGVGGEGSDAASSGTSGEICCLQPSRAEGEPLWVCIRHRSIVNLAGAAAAEMGLGRSDTVLTFASSFFGAHLLDLWMTLGCGARLVIAPPEAASDGARLSRAVAAEGVTFLHASPPVWRRLIDTGLRAGRGLKAMSGGEPLSRELADDIRKRCRVLWNGYGTAETTGFCTLGLVGDAGPVTVGRPLANARVYVQDCSGEMAPVGSVGELLVGGESVAGGYVNQPRLSAAAFTANPYGPGAAYRTGQRARWRDDGVLELMPTCSRRGRVVG